MVEEIGVRSGERNKIVDRIHLLEAQFKEAQKSQQKDFNGAMEKVFGHHAPLLKELAR